MATIVNNKKRDFIPLSYDMVFKKIFGDQNNLEPLRTLLKLVLNIDAEEITILNSEILGENAFIKKTTVDLVVKLRDGTIIGIEMNRSGSDSIMERNLIYILRMMANNLEHSDTYNKMNEFIQLNFDMDGTHVKPIDLYMLVNLNDKDITLTEKLQIYRIDVPYFTRRCYNKNEIGLDYKDRFIGLIGALTQDGITKIVGEDPLMSDIKKRVELCNEDENILLVYDYEHHVKEIARLTAEEEVNAKYKHQMEKLDQELEKVDRELEKIEQEKTNFEQEKIRLVKEKKEVQLLEEITKKSKEIAKNMLAKKIDVTVIAEVTGLTLEQINLLAK